MNTTSQPETTNTSTLENDLHLLIAETDATTSIILTNDANHIIAAWKASPTLLREFILVGEWPEEWQAHVKAMGFKANAPKADSCFLDADIVGTDGVIKSSRFMAYLSFIEGNRFPDYLGDEYELFQSVNAAAELADNPDAEHSFTYTRLKDRAYRLQKYLEGAQQQATLALAEATVRVKATLAEIKHMAEITLEFGMNVEVEERSW